MSKFAKPEHVPLVGIYVLVMASIGIIFAPFAPKLAQLIFPKKSKRKKKKRKYQNLKMFNVIKLYN